MRGVFWGLACGICVCFGYFFGKYGGVTIEKSLFTNYDYSTGEKPNIETEELPKLTFYDELRKPPIYIADREKGNPAIQIQQAEKHRIKKDQLGTDPKQDAIANEHISLEERIARILGQAT